MSRILGQAVGWVLGVAAWICLAALLLFLAGALSGSYLLGLRMVMGW